MDFPDEQSGQSQHQLSSEVVELKEALSSVQDELAELHRRLDDQGHARSHNAEFKRGSDRSDPNTVRRQASAPSTVRLAAIAAALNIISIALIGCVCCDLISKALDEALVGKSRIMATTLAAVLGDPFSVGEYDHMQQILDSAKASNRELSYAIVESSDGRAVDSTDPTLKNSRLTRSPWERQALSATEYVWRPNPADANGFEADMPIRTAGGHGGILRLGLSRIPAMATIAAATNWILAVAVVSSLIVFAVMNQLAKSDVSSIAADRSRSDS